jgi:hypothetical protein
MITQWKSNKTLNLNPIHQSPNLPKIPSKPTNKSKINHQRKKLNHQPPTKTNSNSLKNHSTKNPSNQSKPIKKIIICKLQASHFPSFVKKTILTKTTVRAWQKKNKDK